MADDITKVTKESLAVTRKLTEEQKKLTAASETLNPKFQTLVRDIGKYSKGIATNTAELQLAARNTFAGALQQRKIAQAAVQVGTLLKGSLNEKDTERLAEAMNITVDELQVMGESTRKYNEAEEEAQDAKLKLLEDMGDDERVQLEYHLEVQEKAMAEELDMRDRFNEASNEVIKKVSETEGSFSQFLGGIKELTGVDVGGMLDNVVEKFNAVGKVLTLGKSENAFGSMMSKLTGGMDSMSESMEETGKDMDVDNMGLTEGIENMSESMKESGKDFGKQLGSEAGGHIVASAGIGTLIQNKITALGKFFEKWVWLPLVYFYKSILKWLNPLTYLRLLGTSTFGIWLGVQYSLLMQRIFQSKAMMALHKVTLVNWTGYLAARWREVYFWATAQLQQTVLNAAWWKSIGTWIATQWASVLAFFTISAATRTVMKSWIAAQWSMITTKLAEVKKIIPLVGTWIKASTAWIAAMWAVVAAKIMDSKLITSMIPKFLAASKAFIASMFASLGAMLKHAAKVMAMIPKFIIASVAFIVSMWIALGAMLAEAAAIIIPVLPFILIGIAIIALAALLIWAGMKLYEESELFRSYIDMVIGYFKDIGKIIGDIFGGFYDFFAGLFTGDWDRMFGGLKDIFGGLWDLMLAPFNAIFDWLKETFGIDIGGMILKLARKILPDWALNLLGIGGSEAMDTMQEALVPESEGRKEDRALRDSASESGLYQYNKRGESVVDFAKVGGASDEELQAILRHGDISDEQQMGLLQELQSRAAIGGAGGTTGEALGDATGDAVEASLSAGDQIVVIESSSSSSSSSFSFPQEAREDDRTLVKVN